jgi:FtsZ-binding cell division protein ZapB
MFTRFTDIINSLIALGKVYTQVEMVRKLLRALTPDWEKKTTAIEEANDLSTLTVENLIGNLMAYEVQLEDRKRDTEPKNKKVLAFKASSSDTEDTDDDEEEIAMITRKFKKFLKRGKFSSSNKVFDTNKVVCYGCNKPGHYKKDCPLQKSKFKSSNNFNGFNKNKYEQLKNKKKKALAITWDDSDQSSSDEENDQEEEHQANMCFMADDDNDQVSNNEELLDAFNELFLKYKKLSSSYKILKNENDCLNNTMFSPHLSEIDSLKEMNNSLFNENKKLTDVNHVLKSECDSLKSRMLSLDLSVNSLKSKYEIMSKNVGKFNKGKENLNNLLSYQLPTNSRHGLGYSSKVASSSSNMQKKSHAFLYSRFVKSSNHAVIKESMNTDSMFDHHISKVMHDKKSFKKSSQRSIFIWVPKNACLIDRNNYIIDYKENVCNSVNYLCKNKGKPNSNWVWFPSV